MSKNQSFHELQTYAMILHFFTSETSMTSKDLPPLLGESDEWVPPTSNRLKIDRPLAFVCRV